MKRNSAIFIRSKRGQKGRKLVKYLDDAAVHRAHIKSMDPHHQLKFMSPLNRHFVVIKARIAASRKELGIAV